MEFITKRHDFNNALALLNNYIDLKKTIPSQLFLKDEKYYSFITFDEARMSLFFNHICSFCINIGEENFRYMVTDPAPEDYFYKTKIVNPKIEKYKALICSVKDNDSMFIKALNSYSGGVSPDNMMDNSNVILVSSIDQNWHIVADRDSDIGVCVFYDSATHKNFVNCYGEDLLENVKEADEYAYGETKWGRKINHEKIAEFVNNYSDSKNSQYTVDDFYCFS
jgi:hypothetical protein